MLGHLLGFFLAHGPAQQIGAAQTVATQYLSGLHHLLLVNHDAVGFGQHFFDQGMRILHHFTTVLARHKTGYQIHGARTVQSVERNQIFKSCGLGVFQHALHAATFKLKHRLGATIRKQLVGGHIVKCNILEGKILLPFVALHDHLACQLQNGQCGQAQKVKLHKPNSFHVVFVKLTHGRRTAGLLVQGTKIGELARGNQHTPSVHAHVAGHAFEFLRQCQQGFDFVFFVQTLGQNRLGFDGPVNGDVLTGFIRNELADAVAKHVTHVEHTPHVPNGRTRRHGAKGDNLTDGIAAVFVFHVVNHAVSIGLAKVNVKVGHGHPLWI